MITYVTCDDVDNAFGNAWTSENAKNKAVLMANAWLNAVSYTHLTLPTILRV